MNFFQLPIGAGASDPVVGQIDGAQIRMAPDGTRYYEQYTPPAKQAIVEALTTTLDNQGRASHDRAPQQPVAGKAIVDALLGGVTQGLTAPGRAARGEPVTYGDAWATALDYGALSAPTEAPAGALRSGGIRAYHGSPHDFDRFSMDKIGTGEGAQDMGRGLYFYDDRGSAELYRNPAGRWGDLDAMKRYEGLGPSRVYEVNIDAAPETFLDADAPAASLPSGSKLAARRDAKIAGESDPDFAQTMRDHMKIQNIIRGAERDVLDDGFNGIKRKRYGGETEYVVFDEDLIEIVRKYGIAGAATYLGMPEDEIRDRVGGA